MPRRPKMPRTPESIRRTIHQNIMMCMDNRRERIIHLAEDLEVHYALSECSEIEALCAGTVSLYRMTTKIPGRDVQKIARQLLAELLNTDGPGGPAQRKEPPEEVW
jgi:hypothetical protein